jgi:citrate synthase
MHRPPTPQSRLPVKQVMQIEKPSLQESLIVDSGPGYIRIRDRLIQDLARERRFLEVASYLISGDRLRPEESPFVSAVLKAYALDSAPMEIAPADLQQEPRHLVDAALGAFGCAGRESAWDPATEAGFVWGRILSAITRAFQQRPAESSPGVVPAFLDALSTRALTEVELPLLETHMSLQIESPASPSSREVQEALQRGQGLVPTIRKGLDAFWQENHGLASANLALLLLELRRQPPAAVERQVAAFLSAGRRIPGFGSHEHKGDSKDPRVPVYAELWRKVGGKGPAGGFDQAAQNLRSALEEHRKRQGKPSLPVNPDFYMALLHLACDVPPERIPLSFLLARMVGWSSAYVGSRMGCHRPGGESLTSA